MRSLKDSSKTLFDCVWLFLELKLAFFFVGNIVRRGFQLRVMHCFHAEFFNLGFNFRKS